MLWVYLSTISYYSKSQVASSHVYSSSTEDTKQGPLTAPSPLRQQLANV